MDSIPWVEKYRPTRLEDIVLDNQNREILTNIVKNNHFPHLLFYGPPGTGKTTTMINLIDSFQVKNNQKNKDLMVHLNASDERGIDIIRNQINQFVSSKCLFNVGMKFIVLDEVDYMTKNAQQALKYLLQAYNENVRFCLICNYVSRIDESLQNEFVRLRFNNLPSTEIISFLHHIVDQEKLNIQHDNLLSIQYIHKSDIRSMINFMQCNQDNVVEYKILTIDNWDKLTQLLKTSNLKECLNYINRCSETYCMENINIIKDYVFYLITSKQLTSIEFMAFVGTMFHGEECNAGYYMNYCILRLLVFFKES